MESYNTNTSNISRHYAQQHISRSEKRLLGDYSTLTSHEVNRLIQSCCSEPGDDSSILLAMLFLGRSLEKLLCQDSFSIASAEHPMSGCGIFSIFRDYPEAYSSQKVLSESQKNRDDEYVTAPNNKSGEVYLPPSISNSIAILRKLEWTEQSLELMKGALKKKLTAINKINGTRLTMARVIKYIQFYSHQRGVSEPTIGVLSGEPLGPHAGAHYIKYRTGHLLKIQKDYALFLDEIAKKPFFLTTQCSLPGTWGSNRGLKSESIRNYFSGLQRSCSIAYDENNLESTHNFYTLFALEVLALSTGHRPEHRMFGTIDNIDLITGHAHINDKKSGSNHSRILPLPQIAIIQIEFYIEHLEALKAVYKHLGTPLPTTIDEILNGKKNLFCLINKGRFCTKTPLKKANSITSELRKGPPNYYRHVLRTYFEHQNVPTDLIDWFMGHESKRDHSASRYSAFDSSDFTFVKEKVENLIEHMLQVTTFKSPLVGQR